MKSADQPARRAELAAYFGPNPAKFLATYDQQVAQVNRVAGQPVRFNFFQRAFVWPALFLGPIWFFYRKLYGWGAGLVVLGLILGYFPASRGAGIGLAAASGAMGALVYVMVAIGRIEALRAKRGGGPLDLREVAAAGGVSPTAGWITGILYLIVIALSLTFSTHEQLGGPTGIRSTYQAAPSR